MTIEERLRAEAAASTPDLAAAAAETGLIDVAVARTDSPLGPLLLATTSEGLVRLAFLDAVSEAAVLEDLARRISPRILTAPDLLAPVRRELEEYLSGRRASFQQPVDLRLATTFTRRVLAFTASIPYGQVSTYAQVAAAVGSPKGARAAGGALGSNPVPVVVPCHRVVRTSGELGGYTGGLHIKQQLLALEGVA